MKFLCVFFIKSVFYSLTLFVPIFVYSQTIQLITQDDDKRIMIQQRETDIIKVIPSSGINFKPEFNIEKSPDIILDKTNSFNWELKFSATGKVFKDVSFATPLVGYIVSELGAVYKSTNGGDNWTLIMNLGFPYYWYGVHALTADTVVIAGFNNQGDIHSGVLRWSFDGGATWTNDIILHIPPPGVGWLSRIHFFDGNRGIVSAEFSGGMHYTTNGGKDTTSWNYVQINSDLGWFAGNIDTDTSGNIFTTGIHFAHSSDYGTNWTSGPSGDNVFDGGVDFLDDLLIGLTGGGQISNPVSGWTHKSSDGGQSWSQRLYSFPYPIRAVKLFNDTLGLAFGGNLYQEAGGIYITTDGGLNWNLDINTAAEMFSYNVITTSPSSMDVWCVGSTGGSTGFIGKLYKASIGTLVGIDDYKIDIPSNFQLYQNFPNPFNPSTKISWQSPVGGWQTLKVYDILGNEVATLVNEYKPAGTYEVEFNSHSVNIRDLPSGVYFYQLRAGDFIQTKKTLLLK
jgi:photosystem II stability/assembly factor-like uncharacterized protein